MPNEGNLVKKNAWTPLFAKLTEKKEKNPVKSRNGFRQHLVFQLRFKITLTNEAKTLQSFSIDYYVNHCDYNFNEEIPEWIVKPWCHSLLFS